MPYPFTAFPTLGTFIDTAKAQGCQEGSKVVFSTNGTPSSARFLTAPNGGYAVLPHIADDDRLDPDVLRSLCASLGVTGYEHCFP